MARKRFSDEDILTDWQGPSSSSISCVYRSMVGCTTQFGSGPCGAPRLRFSALQGQISHWNARKSDYRSMGVWTDTMPNPDDQEDHKGPPKSDGKSRIPKTRISAKDIFSQSRRICPRIVGPIPIAQVIDKTGIIGMAEMKLRLYAKQLVKPPAMSEESEKFLREARAAAHPTIPTGLARPIHAGLATYALSTWTAAR